MKIGSVTGVIIDGEGNVTDELAFRAYLASTDEIPIVLGFKDLLEKFEVCFNFPQRRAYIESR